MSTQTAPVLNYARLVNRETFAERISRLTTDARMSDADLASVLGVSENQARRIKSGTTSTLKLDGALRLCRRLRVSPFFLAGESEPALQEVEAEAFDTREPTRLAPDAEMVSVSRPYLEKIEALLLQTQDRMTTIEATLRERPVQPRRQVTAKSA